MAATDQTIATYSRFSRILHWLTLLLMAALFGLAWSFDDYKQPVTGQLIALHKSIGVTILTLTVVRLVWRFVAGVPALPAGVPPWQRAAARVTHYALYALLLAEPLIGWIGSSAAGRSVMLFWLFDMPHLVETDKPLAHTLFGLHGLCANIILALVGLHAVAALYHHYIRRDDVLRAMLGRWA